MPLFDFYIMVDWSGALRRPLVKKQCAVLTKPQLRRPRKSLAIIDAISC